MVGNVKTLLCDNDESKGASHDTFSYSLLIRFNLRLDSFFRNPFTIIFHPTLIYLINAEDGINEQEGNFPKIINRAGWNKQAGRANLKP